MATLALVTVSILVPLSLQGAYLSHTLGLHRTLQNEILSMYFARICDHCNSQHLIFCALQQSHNYRLCSTNELEGQVASLAQLDLDVHSPSQFFAEDNACRAVGNVHEST